MYCTLKDLRTVVYRHLDTGIILVKVLFINFFGGRLILDLVLIEIQVCNLKCKIPLRLHSQ